VVIIHPIIRSVPPIGVIAPNHDIFKITSKYKLTLNISVPRITKIPAINNSFESGLNCKIKAIAKSPRVLKK